MKKKPHKIEYVPIMNLSHYWRVINHKGQTMAYVPNEKAAKVLMQAFQNIAENA